METVVLGSIVITIADWVCKYKANLYIEFWANFFFTSSKICFICLRLVFVVCYQKIITSSNYIVLYIYYHNGKYKSIIFLESMIKSQI